MDFIKYNYTTPSKIYDDEFVLLSDFYCYHGHFVDGKMRPCLQELGEQCYPCQVKIRSDERISVAIFNVTDNKFYILTGSEKYRLKLSSTLNYFLSFEQQNIKQHYIKFRNDGMKRSVFEKPETQTCVNGTLKLHVKPTYQISTSFADKLEQIKIDAALKLYDPNIIKESLERGPSKNTRKEWRRKSIALMLQ